VEGIGLDLIHSTTQ